MALGLKVQLVNKELIRTEYLKFIKDLSNQKIDLKINLDNAQLKKITDDIKDISNIIKTVDFSKIQGTQQINNEIDKITKKVNDLNSSPKKVKAFDESSFMTIENAIDKIKSKYQQLGELKLTTKTNPVTNEIESINVQLTKADGLVEKIKYSLVDLNNIKGYGIVDVKTIDNSSKLYEQVLQKQQAINSNIEKQNAKEKENLANLQKKIELVKQEYAIRIQNLRSSKGSLTETPEIAKQISAFQSSLNGLNISNFNAKQLSNDFKQIEANVKSSSGAIRNTQEDVLSFKDTVGLLTQKLGVFFGVTAIFMKVRQEIIHASQVVSGMDKGLTNVNYTMNLTKQNLDDIGKSAMDYSINLKTSLNNTLEAIQIFSNLNTTLEEVYKKMSPSIMLSNLTGNNVSQSADALQGMIYQFDLSSDKAMHLGDVISKLASTTGVEFTRSINEMTSSVSRGGAVWQQAGGDIESYLAIISTVNEVSRLSGETIANGISTVLSRISRVQELGEEEVSKLEKKYKSLGITIRNSNGEFYDAMTILKNIHEVWNSGISNTEKSLISFEASGTRQAKIFNTLMENFDSIQNRIDIAKNSSEGFLSEKQEIYAESLSAKLQNLRNIADAMWTSLINRGGVKTFLDDFTNVLSFFTNLTSKIGLLPSLFGIVTSALMLFNKSVREFALSGGIGTAFNTSLTLIERNLNRAGITFTFVSAESGILKGALAGLGVMFDVTNIKAKALTIGLNLLKGVGMLAISMFAGFVISKAILAFDEWIHKTERLAEANKELIQTFNQNTQANNDIISFLQQEGKSYDELKNKTNLTKEEQEKLAQIKEKLTQQFPELIQGYDQEGKAILDTSKSAKDYIEILKQKNKLESDKVILQGDDILKEKYEKYQEYSNKIKSLQDDINGVNEISTGNIELGLNNKIAEAKERQAKAIEKYGEGSKQVIQATEQLTQLEGELAMKKKEISVEQANQKALLQEMQPLMNAIYNNNGLNEFQQKLANLSINPLDFMVNGELNTSTLITQIQQFKQKIENDPNYSTIEMIAKMENPSSGDIKKYFDAITDLAKTIGVKPIELSKLFPLKADNNEAKQAVSGYIKGIKEEMNKATGKVKEGLNTKLNLALTVDTKPIDDAKESIGNTTTELQKLSEAYLKSRDSLADLNKAQQEYIDKGQYSESTLNSLIKTYPELIQYMDDQKTLHEILTDKVQEQKVSTQNAYQAMMMVSNQYYQNHIGGINGVEAKLREYGIVLSEGQKKELQNAKNLAEAKLAVESRLVSKLKELWSQFYRVQDDILESLPTSEAHAEDKAFVMASRGRGKDALNKIQGINVQIGKINGAFDDISANIKTPDFGNVGSSLGSSSGSSKSSSPKSSSSKSSSPSIYNGDALNKYDSAIQTINDNLDKTDDGISAISQKISNLQSLESKSNYADIIAEENKKLDEQNKKLSQLGSSKVQAQKLQDQIKGEFYSNWSWMKGKDLSKLTEADWTNLYNKYYGKDINFGTGDSAKANEERYQAGAKKFQDLMKNYQSVTDLMKDLDGSGLKTQEEINSTIKERFEYQTQSYDLELEKQQKVIDLAQYKIDVLDTNDIDNLKEQISLNEELLKANEDNLEKITSIRNELAIQQALISQDSMEWNLLQGVIDEYNDKIQDSTKSIIEQKNTIEELKKSQLEFLANMESDIVDALEKRYEEELKLAKDNASKELLVIEDLTDDENDLIEKGMKTREEIFKDHHQKILDALDEELQLYQDIYDAQIKEIDREEDEDDYNKELNKKQQEKAKLQAQYNSLLLDSSLVAQGKREDLLEQISVKEEEIQEYIHKRSITLRKENLADELEKNKERIQDKIDKENEAYENAKKKYDQETRALERSNEEKLKSDELYAQAREMLMQGNMEALTFLLEKYGSDSEKIFGSMGDKIKQEIVDNLSTAIELVKELKNNSSSINDVSMDDFASGEYDMEAYYKDPELKELQQQLIADSLSLKPKYTKEEYQDKSKSILQKYKIHKLGGLNTETGWHWLDGTDTKPELVLNAEQTKAMIGLKDYLPSFLKSIKMPSMQLPKLDLISLSGITGGSPVELKIDRLINIEGNADKSVIPEIKQAGLNSLTQLRQALNKQGIRKA